MTITYIKYIFHVKIQLFCRQSLTRRFSYLDPDPHWGKNLQLYPAPDPRWNQNTRFKYRMFRMQEPRTAEKKGNFNDFNLDFCDVLCVSVTKLTNLWRIWQNCNENEADFPVCLKGGPGSALASYGCRDIAGIPVLLARILLQDFHMGLFQRGRQRNSIEQRRSFPDPYFRRK
jgi:hypothetical protein